VSGPRLSVVVPAFGEEGRIAATVERLRADLDEPAGALEVVVVDDGSPDATAEAARAAGADRVVDLATNQGKGAAVRAGVACTRGHVVAYTDADLAYPPAQILGMAEVLVAGADVVIGNRRDPASTTVVAASTLRDVGGRAVNLLTRAVLHGRYADTQGGLKVFDGEVARALLPRGRIDGFAFDVELLAIAERWGLHIEQVPVEVAHSGTSTVRVGPDALRLVTDLARIHQGLRQGVYEVT